MKFLFSVLVVTFSLSNLAFGEHAPTDSRQTGPTTPAAMKLKIIDLSQKIQESAVSSRLSAEELLEVRIQLEEINKRLNGEVVSVVPKPPSPEKAKIYAECVTFAKEKFYLSLDEVTSFERAREACKNVVSLEILKMAYEKYFRNLNEVGAIAKATAMASRPKLVGKPNVLKYTYDICYRSMNETGALEKAAALTEDVSESSLESLKKYYAMYYRNLSEIPALEKAVKAVKEDEEAARN